MRACLYPTSRQLLDRLMRCCTFLLIFSSGWIGQSLSCHAEWVDRIVAVVNDDIILLSDFEKAAGPLRERLRQSGYSDRRIDALLESERPAILEQLIVDRLTQQQARRHGITISEAEVTETIERIRQMNNLTSEEMRRMLQMEGMTYETYREHMADQMLRNRIVNREVKSRIVVTDEAISAYYEDNKERYAGKTQYHLRHLLLRVSSSSPADRDRVLQEIAALHARLEKGEAFDRLARLYSQAATAAQGGDLGLFESRMLADPIREALESVPVGQFTPVVETEQGFQIFFVEDVVHSGGRSLDELKLEIQEKLYSEMVDQRFEEWLTALRNRAHIQIIN